MKHTESLKLREEFAHYERSYSLIHESGDGKLIEYRRIFTPDRGAIFLEHRLLGPGGHPFPDGWYLVCDAHLARLNYAAPEICGELHDLKQ